MIFLCLNLRSRALEIGTHDAFINFYIGSKFQLFKFYCLLVMSKSALISPKIENKNKGTTRLRKVPTNPT